MSTSFVRTFLSNSSTVTLNGALRTRDVARVVRVSLRSPAYGKQRGSRVYSTATGSQTATGGRMIKLSYAVATTTLLCSTTYLLGLLAPPPIIQLINPRPAPAPLASESEEGQRYTEKIGNELLNLKMLKECREKEDADEWYETRPYGNLPRERMVNNFTAGALRGPGKIAVTPLVRARKDETEAWVFIHLGRAVCGHDGVVHGGLLATLLDEGCARNAVLAFPSKVGVTANLNLDYKAPTKADQFVVMKTRLVEIKGRKAIIHGQIEDLHGNVLVQARALYIEPKLAGALNAAGMNAIFPTAKHKIGHMTGAPDQVEGEGQLADDGVVKGKS